MDQLVTSYKKSGHLHHAYFLVGDTEIIFERLVSFLNKNVGVKISGNPDFWRGKFTTLTIGDARQVADLQERKSFAGNGNPLGHPMSKWHKWQRKIFIIQADFITEEAQNSLLKVFEEPTSGTHFFIISPQNILLPTLRSRMQTIYHSMEARPSQGILDMKMKKRLEKVKEIVDGISGEEKTKQDAIALLNQLETELHDSGVEKSSKSLEICEHARASLYDRGAPIKMILENVMLSI